MWSRPGGLGDAMAKVRANAGLQSRPVGLRDWDDLKDKMLKLPASISSVSASMPPTRDIDAAANQVREGKDEETSALFSEELAKQARPISSSHTHLPNRDYILSLADPEYQATNSETGNAKRVQKHHATFQCTLCPKRFIRAYHLRSHLRTHTDERPFVCSVCDQAFTRQTDRKRHEVSHSIEKKFYCKGYLKKGGQWGCGRRFARADALGGHFRSEAGRICIKPLLDEEAIERQPLWNEQQRQNMHKIQSLQVDASDVYNLPAALLAQYPALATLSWSESLRGDVGGTPLSITIDTSSPIYVEGLNSTASLNDDENKEHLFGGIGNILEDGLSGTIDFSTPDSVEKRSGSVDKPFRMNQGWTRNRRVTAKSSVGISSTISKDNTPGDCARNANLLADFGRKHQRSSCVGFTNRLPSIADQLSHLPDTTRDISAFSQSPLAPPPPRFSGHGSPLKSPIDFRVLPGPGRNFFYPPRRRPSQVDGTPYFDGLPSPVDYTSSNAETPSDQSTSDEE